MPELNSDLILAIVVAVPIIAGAIVQIVRVTRWGRAHREALDHVTRAVEYARVTTGSVATALGDLRERRETGASSPAATAALKSSVKRTRGSLRAKPNHAGLERMHRPGPDGEKP